MQITPAAQQPSLAATPAQITPSRAAQSLAVATAPRVTTANVSAAALKAANGDGDGKTGTAALNDGDAAAQSARRGAINFKA